MSDIRVSGRMHVGTLREQFKEVFNATLRVYKGTHHGAHFADDDATLASIRDEDAAEKTGELIINGNMHVDTFEKLFMEVYGIKVQVATPDDDKLAKNDHPLHKAGIV